MDILLTFITATTGLRDLIPSWTAFVDNVVVVGVHWFPALSQIVAANLIIGRAAGCLGFP